MKRKKKFLALVLAAVMLLSSITIALAVTTAGNVKLEALTCRIRRSCKRS